MTSRIARQYFIIIFIIIIFIIIKSYVVKRYLTPPLSIDVIQVVIIWSRINDVTHFFYFHPHLHILCY